MDWEAGGGGEEAHTQAGARKTQDDENKTKNQTHGLQRKKRRETHDTVRVVTRGAGRRQGRPERPPKCTYIYSLLLL